MKQKRGPRNAQDRYNDKRKLMDEFLRRRTEDLLFTLGERSTLSGQVQGAQEATCWQEHLFTSRLMLRALNQLDAQPGETYVDVDNRAWKAMQAAFEKNQPEHAETHFAFALLNRNGQLADVCIVLKKALTKDLSYVQPQPDSNEDVEPEWQSRPLTIDDIPPITGAITLNVETLRSPSPKQTHVT
jgi:hypothetical protein